MDAEKKRLRDEVAELSGAVRALRDELVIIRAAYHGCPCVHTVWVYPNVVHPPYQPLRVWCGDTISTYTVTNTLSQGN